MHSSYDSKGLLSVACSECERLGCFSGTLMKKYQKTSTNPDKVSVST